MEALVCIWKGDVLKFWQTIKENGDMIFLWYDYVVNNVAKNNVDPREWKSISTRENVWYCGTFVL